ncbi:protein of unknown function [Legionella micdadei]|uniref:Uncharacterized protein n=1 Tax=Legionella micdadei TaxID=451 RepID=A0A098GGP8_LEGMI|nr:hypothetical protein Lmic_1372 [Legionella micdadei]CEG61152.1 protein of unknown function [Legionella micdadei]SCY31615.1 hypothetical protein SAMN02982997_01363 [Legionella micdadei]
MEQVNLVPTIKLLGEDPSVSECTILHLQVLSEEKKACRAQLSERAQKIPVISI